MLAPQIQLQDFGQVYRAEAGVPEKAVQGIAGLDHKFQFFDRIDWRQYRLGGSRGRPDSCHSGRVEGFGYLRAELVARYQSHGRGSKGNESAANQAMGAHQGAFRLLFRCALNHLQSTLLARKFT